MPVPITLLMDDSCPLVHVYRCHWIDVHHKLPFTLLADEKGDIANKFGVPVSKGGTAKVKIDGKPAELPIQADRTQAGGRRDHVVGDVVDRELAGADVDPVAAPRLPHRGVAWL